MKLVNCRQIVEVDSLQEASQIIRQTIMLKDIGSSRWYAYKDNGLVTINGETAAQISYNGRIWTSPFDIAYAQGKTNR